MIGYTTILGPSAWADAGYFSGGALAHSCFRPQRDRFLIEYELAYNMPGEIINMGMNTKLRLQFAIGEAS